MGLALAMLVFAAPRAFCGADNALHLELEGAGIAFRAERPELYLADPTKVPPPAREPPLLNGAKPTRGIEYRRSNGELRQLVIDAQGWRILDGYGDVLKVLRVPVGFRREAEPLLLGATGPFAWFATKSQLLCVDLGAERSYLRTGRLGSKALGWFFARAGETALFVDGARLLRCEPNLRCTEELRLTSSAKSVVRTPEGLLVATQTELLRIDGPEVETLLHRSPVTLCGLNGTRSWAAVVADAPLVVASVSTKLELHHLIDLLLEAIPSSPTDVAIAWADALVDSDWPERRKLAEAFTNSPYATLRRVAAVLWRGEVGNAALARLWLLGHDPDRWVRETAVHSSAEWCRRDEAMPCRAVLSAFVNDREKEVSWTARDLLLDTDPWAALDGAPVGYRLEAISNLSSRWVRRGEPEVREALERLAADSDPSVRAAARMALMVQ